MLLRNGIIGTENGARRGDVRLDGGVILAIQDSLVPMEGEAVVDCAGKFILPGGVDVHAHLDSNVGGLRTADNLFSGMLAAACGGTTTVVNHIAASTGDRSIHAQLEYYRRQGETQAVIDYGLHGVVDHVDGELLDELAALVKDGVTSYKIYLAGVRKLDDPDIMRLLARAGELGALVVAHAEDDGVIRYRRELYRAQGKIAPVYHAMSRPEEGEALAVMKMLLYARMAGDVPLYLCHVTNAFSLECIRMLRRSGLKHVFAEACTHHLLLDNSKYLDPDGVKYIVCPPLRSPRHVEALWEAVRQGAIDSIASDHTSYHYRSDKRLGAGDFTRAPGGIPGVEERMPLLFHEVSTGRLTLGQMVRLCCANPARLFGLYPRKGVVAPGSDADLVVIDPAKRVTLSVDRLHSRADYSAYEGRELQGYPVMVFSRGELIVENGCFLSRAGRGRFLSRSLPDLGLQDGQALDN